MKRKTLLLGPTLMVALSLATLLAAEESIPPEEKTTERRSPSDLTPAPLYKPPLRGAPNSRVGGASRGESGNTLFLAALAAQHTGWTVSAQPALYWYISGVPAVPMEFVINDGKSTVLEIRLNPPSKPGVQQLRLSAYKINLKPNIDYEWFVALVSDPDQRANDIVAGGTLRRVQPSAMLQAKLNRAGKQDLPFIYAEEGLWYDAIAALSEQIDTNPRNKGLREQRAALLDQVGLSEVAAYDRRTAAGKE